MTMTMLDPQGYLEPPKVMRLRPGVDFDLEEEANKLLAAGRAGITALCDKRDYLTHDQLMLRAQREVLCTEGFPEENYYRGMFRRTYSPTFGHRPRGVKNYDDDD